MLEVKSLDFSVTDAMETEIKGVETAIYKHLPENNPVQVTLSKASPDVFRVDIQTNYVGEKILSHHESHNFHKALELCKDHFIKMVVKKKGNLQDRRKS